MIKILGFPYKKDETEEFRKVLVLKEDDEAVEGIDFQRLDKETREELAALFEALQEVVDSAVKEGYRRFLKKKISGEVEELRPMDI